MNAAIESKPKKAVQRKKQPENAFSALKAAQENQTSRESSTATVNTNIPAVHSADTAYSNGSEQIYSQLQESFNTTGNLNNAETQQKEKDYKSTLSIPELRAYNDAKLVTPNNEQTSQQTSTASGETNIKEAKLKPVKTSVAAETPITENSKQEQGASKDDAKGEKEAETKVPENPMENPGFIALQEQVSTTAKQQQHHAPASKSAQEAQAAAESPSNERESMAQASQVATMDAQEPGLFDRDAFKAELTKKIEGMKLPENEEQADDFENHNNIDEVNQRAMGDVAQQKNAASGSIATTTAAEPNTSAQPVRNVVKMKAPNTGKAPAVANVNKAMPAKRSAASVEAPIKEQTATIDEQMSENGVTDTMLANSNEPSFMSALDEKNKAKTQSQEATNQFRANEEQQLAQTQNEAQAQANQQVSGMYGARKGKLNQVQADKNQTASKDTEDRKKVANDINAIYNETKIKVDEILNGLDDTVADKFETGSKAAKAAFEKHVADKMSAYKKKRYGDASKSYGVLASAGLWLWDKVTGLPDEVNEFFVSGREVYIKTMDSHIDKIADHVTTQLNAAKAEIAKGKKDVQNHVEGLSPRLRKLGKAAINDIQSKFDALEEDVNNKKDALIDALAEKYAENVAAIDARIEELKAQNQGLVGMVMNAVSGIINFIIDVKNTLTNLLSKIAQVIGAIITDPIGFFGMLIDGLTQGFSNFTANIWTHLKTGFFGWLTGAMKGITFTMPDNPFSLKGIFSMSMQLLGMGWQTIRAIGAKVIGEPIMKVLEGGLEVVQVVKRDGISGLWDYLKDQFQDLKATVMDAIMGIIESQVIQAGIKWILGLLSPVGAFVKAAMAIIDVVKFFVQRAAQIMELVNAFIDSVAAIASGKVGAVAKAIENALAKSIPVLIGLLASILGISGLADKVLGVIRKIRKRIVDGITKFWKYLKRKGKGLLRKIGSNKKVKNLYNKGRDKVSSMYDYFMGTISFTSADGSRHKIYPKSKKDPKNIILASTPRPIEIQLDSEIVISGEQGDTDNVKKIQKAKDYYLKSVKTKISDLELIQEKEESSKRDADGSKKRARIKAKKLADERDENFLFLRKLLEQASFSHGKKVEIETEINPQNDGTAGGYVEALPLTHIGEGQPPGSANPPGWEFAQSLNKQAESIIYIRGHMVNEGLGGPNSKWNLKPISNRMNREMDQKIETHAQRERNQKHKILYYRATVNEYHKGDKDEAGAFPSRLTVVWGHLMKNGKFDAAGDKKVVQREEFKQSAPVAQSIPINELGQDLLVRALKKEGISEQFTKEVVIYLKKRTTHKRFDNFEDFTDLYIDKIDGTKRDNPTYFSILTALNSNKKINF